METSNPVKKMFARRCEPEKRQRMTLVHVLYTVNFLKADTPVRRRGLATEFHLMSVTKLFFNFLIFTLQLQI